MPSFSRRDFMAGSAAIIGFGAAPGLARASTVTEFVDGLVAGQTPRQGGRLTYGNPVPNWALGQSDRGTHPYYFMDIQTRSIWNALTWVDENLEVRGELATEFASNDDGTVWEYKLREGVVFHDGREFTSKDAVASCRLHADPRLGGVGFLKQYVESVEPMGDHGIRFHLNQPNVEFPHATAEYRAMMLPARDDLNEMGYDGIGTGAFRLLEIDNKRQFRAERNEDFWMPGRPYIDELVGVLAMGANAINGFRAEQFDMVLNADPGQFDQFRDAGGVVETASSGDQFWLVLPKNVNFPWNDVRVRKAMSLAIDRPRINTIIYNDPEGWTGNDTHMNGANKEFLPRPVERDVAQAKALLAEAGYPDGIDLPAIFYCATYPEEPRLWAVVGESLKEAGINLQFSERPCDGFNPFVSAVNKPIGRPRRNLIGARNPAINLSRASNLNDAEPGGWEGPGFDRYNALLSEAAAEKDAEKRLSIYHEMQRIAQDEVPGVMVGGRRTNLVYREGWHNLRPHTQLWQGPRFETVWKDG
ncbi:ABC transporter substrate-binding protein [Pseudooceanicola algae]|uniref:HTH-type transcriptional regulator SgrR n=1 Tax=Pseudooceanicola algae TaxID=1537215 RepID=A0A418SEQ9_9RHOB|nr:ABC transporter substrate-binding protein [Pseudooceanicola algae]QPM89810.1 HTH-type transcriptional regulator SgrR [Pseudooceanicola algae]